jgi:hypothetical protein
MPHLTHLQPSQCLRSSRKRLIQHWCDNPRRIVERIAPSFNDTAPASAAISRQSSKLLLVSEARGWSAERNRGKLKSRCCD